MPSRCFSALIYGVGEYFISTAALSRMLDNWFQSHLGVVTGIVMAASGVGGSALSLVLRALWNRPAGARRCCLRRGCSRPWRS